MLPFRATCRACRSPDDRLLQPERHLRIHVTATISLRARAARPFRQARCTARLLEHARGPPSAALARGQAAPAVRAFAAALPQGPRFFLWRFRCRRGGAVITPGLGSSLSSLCSPRPGEAEPRGGRHHPETVRKVLHVSMGLTTLGFPWLFDERWPVLVLASLAYARSYRGANASVLRTHFGSALTGVAESIDRRVLLRARPCAVFLLSSGRPAVVLDSMLILTFADAAAALIGTWYGRHYWKHGGQDPGRQRRVPDRGAVVYLSAACSAHHGRRNRAC